MNKIENSKNIRKISIILSFIILVLSIIIAFGSKILDRNYSNRLNKQKNFKEFNISEYRIREIFDKNVKNRIIKKSNHKVFIGENDKQIENGYYDVKIYIQSNKCIVICLNKLWKEFDEKLYEEEYITKLSESIKELLNINVPRNQIYDYILSGYLEAKNGDNDSNSIEEYILELDSYVIKGKVSDKEFVMSIYKK